MDHKRLVDVDEVEECVNCVSEPQERNLGNMQSYYLGTKMYT